MKKQVQSWLLATGMALMTAAPAFAQASGSATQIATTLNTAANWMQTIFGPGLFVIGLILAGISLAGGNEQGLERGKLAVYGGTVIFLSGSIVALLRSWTGN